MPTPADSYRASLKRFNGGPHGATAIRRGTWKAKVALSTGAIVSCAKLPTHTERIPQEQGGGFVQQSMAIFLFPAGLTFVPTIGVQFTLNECEDATAEVGTLWGCNELKSAGVGHEHRVVCFRLD